MAPEPLTPKKWLNRIDASLKSRDKEAGEKGWKRFRDMYEGKYPFAESSGGRRIVPINLVFAYVHTEIPKLYFRDPYISVNPRGTGYIERAKILEVAVNYLFAELNLKNEIFKVLLDALIVGHGWLKFGYSGTFGKMTTSDTARMTQVKKRRQLEEVNEFVKPEEIFVLHVPWEDMAFDPAAQDPPYDCRWLAHRVIKPLEAVKSSELYKNTAGLKSNFSFSGDQRIDLDYPLVELWEVSDKDTGSVYVVAKGHEDYLRNTDNPYLIQGLPFSMLKFNPVPRKPYALSDVGIIEPQILERIKLRNMQLNHIKRFGRQLIIEKGSISEKELDKYALGVDGSIVFVEPGAIQKMRFPEYPPMQSEIFKLEELTQMDMDTVIGQTQTERGAQAQTRTRTLGEVQLQHAGAQTRADRKRDALEDFLEEVTRKTIELLKQFQIAPRYVRNLEQDPETIKKIVGDRFDGQGISFKRDDIQGDYDVEVKMGSTIPLNKENRLAILTEILKLGPGIGILPGGPVARAVGKEILRDLNLKEAERAFAEEERMQNSLRLAQAGAPTNNGGNRGMPQLSTKMPGA